jgi:hypothetical protein
MRYVVKEGSESGHCCFEHSVIDTLIDYCICECFAEEEAIRICDSLNKQLKAEKENERLKHLGGMMHILKKPSEAYTKAWKEFSEIKCQDWALKAEQEQ